MAWVTNSRAIPNARFARKYLSAAVLKSFRNSHFPLNFPPFRLYKKTENYSHYLYTYKFIPVLNYVHTTHGNITFIQVITFK